MASLDDLLRTHRTSEFSVELLDEHDQLVRPLHEFTGGSIEQNRFREIRGGGTLHLASRPQEFEFDIDWGRARFRVLQYLAGYDWPIPWGVYLPDAPTQSRDDDTGSVSADVTLMDKLAIPAQDGPDETYTLPAGTNAVNAAVGILNSLGETRVTATASAATLPAARSWLISGGSVTWLRIINDLLASVNYFSLWCDENGVFRISPHRPSGSEAPSWVFDFSSPRSSLYLRNWSISEDWFSTPNKVILVSQGDSEAEALVATAVNNDPGNKFSVPARGRTISIRETGVEASSQAVLDGLAARRLADVTSSVTNLEVVTAPLPLWPNSLVEFNPAGGESYRCTISNWTLSLDPGALMAQTWRQVFTL